MRLLPAILSALALVTAARANDNDLQLYRLGNPDPIKTCTKCDGSGVPDLMTKPGDPLAQERFAKLASELGLAILPHFLSPAESEGQAGFEYSVSMDAGFVHGNGTTADNKAYWVTEANTTAADGTTPSAPPGQLLLPTLHIRKGLPFSFEFGADAGWIINSSMVALSVDAKWTLNEGFKFLPDLTVRGTGTRLVGANELDLTLAAFDIALSKAFTVGGIANLTPFLGWSRIFLDAASAIINFDPYHQENGRAANGSGRDQSDSVFRELKLGATQFDRFYGGLRYIQGVAVLAFEVDYATGRAPIGDGADLAAKMFSTSELSTAVKLGVDF